MKSILTLLSVATLLLLTSACSSTQTKKISQPTFTQHPFSLVEIETPQQIFSLSNEIKSDLLEHVDITKSKYQISKQLLEFIFMSSEKALNYRTGATFTANETFATQNANCLSLSIMAYSMANHLGIKTRFQAVDIPEYWANQNGYNLLTGHVNLRVLKIHRSTGATQHINFTNDIIIDFNPDSRKQRFDTEFISKKTITAMFYNNKGAAAMLDKNFNLAYSYFSAAISYDPDFSSTYGNLGVLFRINGLLDDAERAYDYAVSLDNNLTALGNLAILYQLTDRTNLSKNILSYLENKRKSNPYYHIAKGNEAHFKNELGRAIKHFKRAIELDNKIHESHFGLAKVYYLQGRKEKTRQALLKAKRTASFDSDKERYQSKLHSLSAMRQ